MFAKKAARTIPPCDMTQGDSREPARNAVGRIAPAVALLLLADPVLATDSDESTVPEPSMLSLVGIGVGVAAAAKYVQNRRRNK